MTMGSEIAIAMGSAVGLQDDGYGNPGRDGLSSGREHHHPQTDDLYWRRESRMARAKVGGGAST